MGSFRRVIVVASCVVATLAAPSVASATQFKGAVAYWGDLAISVSGTSVTSISGQTGSVDCASGTSLGPLRFAGGTPVTIVNGRFHAEGAGKISGYTTPASWSIDASISIRRVISGTVKATAQTAAGETCTGTYPLTAIVAPRQAHSPQTSMFQPHMPPTGGTVRFDYRNQVVTHLVVAAGITCPNGTTYGGEYDSVTYGLDSIQVNRGHFKVVADAIDSYGVVVHLSLTGTINGRHAAGYLSASRGQGINGNYSTCTGHGSWRSDIPATAPPPDSASGGAFYDARPYRVGSPGAWTYSVLVQPTSCGGGVVAVRFTIAGASRTVKCGTAVKLGPLKPKHTYHLTAKAIRANGSTVALADSTIYVPGDDGDWIRLP